MDNPNEKKSENFLMNLDSSDASNRLFIDNITDDIAKHLIMQKIKKLNLGLGPRDPDQTASVFFKLMDLQAFLNKVPGNAGNEHPENYGLRIYFAEYDDSDPIIRQYIVDNGLSNLNYEDRPTAVLQLMTVDNKTFVKDSSGKHITANLGQLCPPKCPDGHTRADDKFWDPTI